MTYHCTGGNQLKNLHKYACCLENPLTGVCIFAKFGDTNVDFGLGHWNQSDRFSYFESANKANEGDICAAI